MKLIISLFFILLVLFPFGQLTKMPLSFLGIPEIHLYLIDIVLGLLIVFWLVWRFVFNKKPYTLPSLARPIFLFSLVSFLSLLVNLFNFSLNQILVGFLYWLRWFFYAGLYFVIADLKEKFVWLKKDLFCFLTIIGFMVGFFALVQYLIWPNLKVLEYLQYDPHFYRTAGTFLDPGFTGIILLLTIILITFRIWSNKGKKAVWIALWSLLYIVLALTYSRASWLSFFVFGALFAFYKKSLKFFFLIIGLLFLTWIFVPQPSGEGGNLQRTYSVVSRFGSYRQSFEIFSRKPILGVGFNTYRYTQEQSGFFDNTDYDWQKSLSGAGVDNSLLFVLATTGILGLATYLWLLLKSLGNFKNEIIVVSLVPILVHSLFLNSLFYIWVMIWFWLLLAKENS